MPDKNSTIAEKLGSLRKEFNAHGVDGFLIPHDDEYQGEYTPAYAERLQWMTNFSGSAGHAVVLKGKAVVMSDSRYTIQLGQEVDSNHYDTANSQEVKITDWLVDNASENSVIGYDPCLHTAAQIAQMESDLKDSGITLKPLDANPVDNIWDDQPALPKGIISLCPDDKAGQKASDKIAQIFADIQAKGAAGFVVSMSDSIAWLLNVRGSDIPFNPVPLSIVIMNAEEEQLQWYVDPDKVPADVQQALAPHVTFLQPHDIEMGLHALAGAAKTAGKPVWVDHNRSSIWFKNVIEDVGAQTMDGEDPCVMPKAIKNDTEMSHIRQAHVEDGVAMVKFLKWLDENAGSFTLDEMAVADQLEIFRQQGANYKQPSFSTISGFAENGAIVHYHATRDNNRKIDTDGLLLVDSGGQYDWGTTDITRTMAVGTPTQEMKESYTLVLKSHIALARQKFPQGTTGAQIDAITRAPLWGAGLDFGHGTGHGVGFALCVHEGPVSISSANKTRALVPGLFLSNEPGYYKEGEYGIRIENLVHVRDAAQLLQGAKGKLLYEFETVTLAPMDMNLVVPEMMHVVERAWLNEYHEMVRQKLSPHLDQDHKDWLDQATPQI